MTTQPADGDCSDAEYAEFMGSLREYCKLCGKRMHGAELAKAQKYDPIRCAYCARQTAIVNDVVDAAPTERDLEALDNPQGELRYD